MLRDEQPNIHAAIAGEGPSRWQLDKQVRANGMDRIVHLLGHRSDVPALLAAADIFALPSHREGLPLALLEAMASGLPVIATDVGGCCEVIENGRNGILISPGSPEQMARAIKRLALDEGLRRALGDAARQTIEQRFSIDRMVRQVEELYLCSS